MKNRRLAIFCGIVCLVLAANAITFSVLLAGDNRYILDQLTPTPTAGISATMPPIEVTYSKEALEAGFTNPGAEYRFHMISHGYGDLGANAKSVAQKYASQGVGGVVTNVAWGEKYIDSSSNFAAVTQSFKAADEAGLKYWLYDELGYPSGNAGGRTVINNPEYVAKGLVSLSAAGKGQNEKYINQPSDVTRIYNAYAVDSQGKVYPATISENKASFAGTEGDWTLYLFCEKKLYEGTHAETNGWKGEDWLTRDYVNLMDKDAIKKFIDLTYGAYAKNVEQFKSVTGIFTDEPSLMECYQNNTDVHTYAQISWVDGFADRFEQMHGYGINEKLNFLFEGTGEEAKTVRMNYRQTVAQMVSENYFKQISDFCEANGTKSSGHLLLEESIEHQVFYYGNLMQCIRQEGIPGVDVLTGNPEKYMKDMKGPYFMAPKYVGSAARLAGKDNLVMVEVCPTDVDANAYKDINIINGLRGTVNLIFFSGINHINSYVDPTLLGKEVNHFTDYFARTSYITRNSEWASEIGMYYPIGTIQSNLTPSKSSKFGNEVTNYTGTSIINRITLDLYKKQMDYTMVDDQFIREAQIQSGHLVANGIAFKVVFMPSVETVPLDVLKKLMDFQSAGGKVVWVGRTPAMGNSMEEHAQVKALAKGLTAEKLSDELYAGVKSFIGDPLKTEGISESIFISKYTTGGTPMYWLLNNSKDPQQFNVSMDGDYTFDIYDPTTGEVTSTGNNTSVTLQGYTTKFLIVKQNK